MQYNTLLMINKVKITRQYYKAKFLSNILFGKKEKITNKKMILFKNKIKK